MIPKDGCNNQFQSNAITTSGMAQGIKSRALKHPLPGKSWSKSNARKKETEIMTAPALTEKIKLVESDSQNLSLVSIFS